MNVAHSTCALACAYIHVSLEFPMHKSTGLGRTNLTFVRSKNLLNYSSTAMVHTWNRLGIRMHRCIEICGTRLLSLRLYHMSLAVTSVYVGFIDLLHTIEYVHCSII